jgi:hypothetical protein
MEATSKNLDGYGAPPIAWDRVRTAFATDINPDGAPHVVGVGIAQVDGVWYFTSEELRSVAPWHVSRLTVHTVYALATTEPYGATKFEVT